MTSVDDIAYLDNGTVKLTLSREYGWAITQITIGEADNYVRQDDGIYANRIGVWTDSGNLYQFGMEYMQGCTPGTFGFVQYLGALSGEFVEHGPLRWRFVAVPEIVTALETTPENAPQVQLSGTVASFKADRAVWSLRAPFVPGDAKRFI